jgi:hypothetical protein
MTFVSNLVGDLVWPAVVVIAFFTFRKPIGKLLPGIRSFRGPGFEATFAEQAGAVATQADALTSEDKTEEVTGQASGEVTFEGSAKGSVLSGEGGQPRPIVRKMEAPPEVATWTGTLRSVAKESPRAVVTEAWSQVEHELVRLGSTYGTRMNPVSMVKDLADRKIIPPEIVSLVMNLRSLRNEVTHNADLNPDEDGALSYLDAATSVVTALQKIPTAEPLSGPEHSQSSEGPDQARDPGHVR